MPTKKQPPSRQTLHALQAAQLEESIKKEERMLDMRQGKPSSAAVRTGNTRVLVVLPPKAAEVYAEKPIDASLGSKDTKALAEDMSRSLWSSLNPGYMQQEPGNLRSVASADYSWNEQEVDYIRRHDRVGDKFHRRWDQQSRYNEAAAKHRPVMQGSKQQAPGAVKAS
ncbi:g11195 [Coccomyxa viridis]|uniref:G11195 protein n=1 Tax=Coccomyxa viridis TaxID=1274662 RepID=A0ABP1GED9_9CHLO